MLASVGPSRQTGCCCCSLLLALAYATVMILMMMLPLDRQWKTAYTHNVSAERQKGMWSWVMQCTHQHFPQLFNLRWLLISPGAPTHNSPHSLLDFFFSVSNRKMMMMMMMMEQSMLSLFLHFLWFWSRTGIVWFLLYSTYYLYTYNVHEHRTNFV